MNEKKQQILAALKKLGKSSPLQISEHTNISASLTGYHLRGLAAAGMAKASGTTSSRTYEATDSAPPQERKPRKGKKKRKSPETRAARARSTSVPEFIPGLTADGGLVVVNPAAGDPVTFNPEQTSKLADLLFAHYEA